MRRFVVLAVLLLALLGSLPGLATAAPTIQRFGGLSGGTPRTVARQALVSSRVQAASIGALATKEATLTLVRSDDYDIVGETGTWTVVEGLYTNSLAYQIEDPWVRIELRNDGGDVLEEDIFQTNDNILLPGGAGTFRIGLDHPGTGYHFVVAGVYGFPSIAGRKYLSVSLESTSAQGTVRHYRGTVTNNLPFDMTDIKVSAVVRFAGGGTGVAFDDTLYNQVIDSGDGRLRARESTSFDLVCYSPLPGAAELDVSTLKAEAASPSWLGIKASTTSPVVGTAATLTGRLLGSPDWFPVTGRPLSLYRVRTGGDELVATVPWGSLGNVHSVKPTTKTSYYALFWGDSAYGYSRSSGVTIYPKAYVTTPSAPSSTYRRRSFTSAGYLKPRHTSGSKTVLIRAYRLERGKWVLRKTAYPRNANYSTYTRYSVSTSLPYAGRWRIRAYSKADSQHAAGYSAFRYVTVR